MVNATDSILSPEIQQQLDEIEAGFMQMNPEKVAYFEQLKQQRRAITFDDVVVEPGPSETPASDVDLTTRFSRRVELHIPFVSAAMDRVTESKMAIAMAKLGGLGVIHAGLSIEEQRHEVRKVKLHLNGLVEKPITFSQHRTIGQVLEECDRKGFDFRTFPITGGKNKTFVGLLSQNDFDFCDDLSARVGDVMTPAEEVISAVVGTDMHEAYEIMRTHKKKILPLLGPTERVRGLYVLDDVKRLLHGNPGRYALDANGRLLTAAAVPTDPDEAVERLKAMGKYLDAVVIDSAQGDSHFARDTIEALVEARNTLKMQHVDIVGGNISSNRKSARMLIKAGVDGIKVGQGPGAICTTRRETGIGCPQLTAVYETFAEAHGDDVPICADGGIVYRGDPGKAIAAGADTVMMGSRLAGAKEAPGRTYINEKGELVKDYRGMGSSAAIRDSAASRKRYAMGGSRLPAPEGVEAEVPVTGPVEDTLSFFVDYLRKGMSYAGSADVREHRLNTNFWEQSLAGSREAHPHDVNVIG